MKSKCFVCALVAGMAMSAVAVAEPGQPAGAAPVQATQVVGGVQAMPKGLIPGHARYHYATRTWEIIRRSSYVGQDQPENPAVRGPGPNLIWSAVDPSGFYWNHVGSTLVANEIRDGGVLCGDPMVDTHTVNQISFAYQTQTVEVPGLGVSLNLYSGWDPFCVAGPNGGIADFNGALGCIATNVSQYDIIDLPGSVAGEAVAYLVDIDLTGVETVMPAGPFGWSFHTWVGFASPTGPLLAAENQISGPGMENGFDVFTAAPQVTPLLGNFWFGGSPFAQFWFEVYSADTTCAPPTAGACCLADLSCVVAEEVDCQAQGGTWTVAGQACQGAFFCYPAPANDDCLNAEAIVGFGQFPYDNRGATTGTEGDPTCGPQGEDVWMSWTSPCSGSVTITGCLLNTEDDLWAVYTGGCGALTEVGCSDDDCSIVGGPSQITFTATQGTAYLFRLGTWNSTDGAESFVEVIQGGDCVGGGFCDADWCQDGSVGVPDIFCFLSDWFAESGTNGPARCFGGTCDVPAIFAFLTEWFGTPQGPCTP